MFQDLFKIWFENIFLAAFIDIEIISYKSNKYHKSEILNNNTPVLSLLIFPL